MRRGHVAICCALLLTSASATSRADFDRGRVVVLPVETIGHMRDAASWRAEFALRLVGKLKDSRFQIVQDKLGTREALCREPACLAQVAQAHRAGLIVGAKVVNDEALPPTFRVRVWIFDAHRPTEIARSVERSYPNGSEADAADGLEKLLGEALAPEAKTPPVAPAVEPDQAVKVPPAPSHPPKWIEPTPPTPQPPPDKRRAHGWRRPLYLALGGIGAAGVAASVTAVGVKGSEYGDRPYCSTMAPPARQCPYFRDTSPGIYAASVVGVGSAALMITGFILAARADARPHAMIAPSFGPHSAGAEVWLSF